MLSTKPAVPTDEASQDISSTIKPCAMASPRGIGRSLRDLDVPPPGSISKAYRNLLRDQPKAEQVEAGPSPRDLAPAPKPPTHKFDF